MENYTVTVSIDREVQHFEVAEYPYVNGDSCKYKVLQGGALVATFEPDNQHILHVCHNPGGLEEELLHLLADQIEAMHPGNLNFDDDEDEEF